MQNLSLLLILIHLTLIYQRPTKNMIWLILGLVEAQRKKNWFFPKKFLLVEQA